MKCNYDTWSTRVIKKPNQKMLDALRANKDGVVRTRSDFLRRANIVPNPRTSEFEKTDYYLYRLGLIEYVGEKAGQKLFRISTEGMKLA